jgi:hypothetical protein
LARLRTHDIQPADDEGQRLKEGPKGSKKAQRRHCYNLAIPSWHYLKRTSTLNLKTSACLNRLRKLSLRRTTTGVVRRDDRLKVVP